MLEFNPVSVDSFIISFSNRIDLKVSEEISRYFRKLEKIDEIIDVVPSYTTILVTFDIFNITYEELKEIILNIKLDPVEQSIKSNIVEIPVYYGEEVGLDLNRISELNNISIDEIIDIHSSSIYTVFTIGFAPGFAYLGEVSEKIATPRLTSPRKLVKKGSLALADTQTAIYPQNSPGGWNIIGATTFDMFDKNNPNLCPLKMGDKIKFKSISKEEFIELGGEF